MTRESEWDEIRGRHAPLLGIAGTSLFRIVLLFGSAAVALTLILAPLADRYTRTSGIDYTSTGSIGQRASYTIRRSVLQRTDAVCIIHSDGRRSGDC